jgi:hypothetical protein
LPQVGSDALEVDEVHEVTAAEASLLRERSADVTAAVGALRDGRAAAAVVEADSHATAAAALDACGSALEAMLEAQVGAEAATRAGFEQLRTEVRGDVVPRLTRAVSEARTATSGTLVGALDARMAANHQRLAAALAERSAAWGVFAAAAGDKLVGAQGAAPVVARHCRALRAALGRESKGASADALAARLVDLGATLRALDADAARAADGGRRDLEAFAAAVEGFDDASSPPQPTGQLDFFEAIAASPSAADLVADVHRDNPGLYASMLQKVAALLALHNPAFAPANDAIQGTSPSEERESTTTWDYDESP